MTGSVRHRVHHDVDANGVGIRREAEEVFAILAFVFTEVFRAGVPPDYPGVAYVTFVAVALWPWVMFSEGLNGAMGSIALNTTCAVIPSGSFASGRKAAKSVASSVARSASTTGSV